ncbi:hypothetical protein C1645_832899 [Glomus cerebriforme]|uniref:Uncharacterized protein n=1 Tax=Glomus cerebriforme TaxID=658196 RepID=A0A397SEN8_9GLOM|nr:hypothetical protein C1645_832899 [Glomus cerebriforme]
MEFDQETSSSDTPINLDSEINLAKELFNNSSTSNTSSTSSRLLNSVWPNTKIQLFHWHLRRAVETKLKETKLPKRDKHEPMVARDGERLERLISAPKAEPSRTESTS